MNYSFDSIIYNIVYSAFENRTLQEFAESIASFFEKYMPVSTLGIYEFNVNEITKVILYSSYNGLFKFPDKITMDEELLKKMHLEESLEGNTSFSVKILRGDTGHAYCEVYNMLHSKDMTSIYCPLDGSRQRFFYLSISSMGKNCYGEDDLELCRMLRRPLSNVLISILRRNQASGLPVPDSVEGVPDIVAENQEIETLDEYTAAYIRKVIEHTKGRISGRRGAAALLGIPASTLWSKMRKLQLYTPGKKRR